MVKYGVNQLGNDRKQVIDFGWTLFNFAKKPYSCCAISCTNRRGEKPGLCFHRILSEKKTSIEEEIVGLCNNKYLNNGSRPNTLFSSTLGSSKYKYTFINHC